mgnify:CR=1 FL=1
MDILSFSVVALASFLAAGLTMYSGFGLGTLMLPVFALFFPVEMAVVATALVHLSLIHISEPTRQLMSSRMPSSA